MIRNLILELNKHDKHKLIQYLQKNPIYIKIYSELFLKDNLETIIKKNSKVIDGLRELINKKEIPLQFLNLFNTKSFDTITPYIIIAKYVNREKTSFFTNWIKKFPYISLNAATFKNMPKAIQLERGGSFDIYIFQPSKKMKDSTKLFLDIKSSFDNNKLDIERTFIMISSVYYEDYNFFIGKKIKYNEAFLTFLRQFLFFKTGNISFTKKANFIDNLINLTDKTTLKNIIFKLPLFSYIQNIKITPKEENALIRASLYSDSIHLTPASVC